MAKEVKKFEFKGRFAQIIVLAIVVLIITLVVCILVYSNGVWDFKKYKLECSKEDSYFENLSLANYNDTLIEHVIEIKKQSDYCSVKEVGKIGLGDLSELECDCIEWNCDKQCNKGLYLVNSTCHNKGGMQISRALIPCSRFLCKDYIVDSSCKLLEELRI